MATGDRDRVIELLKPAVERYQSAPWSRATFIADAELIRRDRPTNSCVLLDAWKSIGGTPTAEEWESVIVEAWDRFAAAPPPQPAGTRSELREDVAALVNYYEAVTVWNPSDSDFVRIGRAASAITPDVLGRVRASLGLAGDREG